MLFLFVNTVHKVFYKPKLYNFGLSFKELNIAAKRFGFPVTWKSRSSTKMFSPTFNLLKVEKSLREIVLFNSSNFNSNLRKFILKRIRILKINRTLRGVRHTQFLPVRGQRTKTNAKTQKSRRK